MLQEGVSCIGRFFLCIVHRFAQDHVGNLVGGLVMAHWRDVAVDVKGDADGRLLPKLLPDGSKSGEANTIQHADSRKACSETLFTFRHRRPSFRIS